MDVLYQLPQGTALGHGFILALAAPNTQYFYPAVCRGAVRPRCEPQRALSHPYLDGKGDLAALSDLGQAERRP